MENVTRALIIVFGMLIFVISFSFSMYLINNLTTTANALLDTVATTNYYDNIEVESDVDTRIVNSDTIVPTLYRYYKEQYAVQILDTSENVIQLFDLDMEGKIASAAASTTTEGKNYYLKSSIYNTPSEKAYMFEAPWMGNINEDAKMRIDYFLNGTVGYINNVKVDYSSIGGTLGGFLNYAKNKKFEERFIEFVYEGETISTDDGLETITGNTQENSKIMITYKEI